MVSMPRYTRTRNRSTAEEASIFISFIIVSRVGVALYSFEVRLRLRWFKNLKSFDSTVVQRLHIATIV